MTLTGPFPLCVLGFSFYPQQPRSQHALGRHRELRQTLVSGREGLDTRRGGPGALTPCPGLHPLLTASLPFPLWEPVFPSLGEQELLHLLQEEHHRIVPQTFLHREWGKEGWGQKQSWVGLNEPTGR